MNREANQGWQKRDVSGCFIEGEIRCECWTRELSPFSVFISSSWDFFSSILLWHSHVQDSAGEVFLDAPLEFSGERVSSRLSVSLTATPFLELHVCCFCKSLTQFSSSYCSEKDQIWHTTQVQTVCDVKSQKSVSVRNGRTCIFLKWPDKRYQCIRTREKCCYLLSKYSQSSKQKHGFCQLIDLVWSLVTANRWRFGQVSSESETLNQHFEFTGPGRIVHFLFNLTQSNSIKFDTSGLFWSFEWGKLTLQRMFCAG